MKILNTASDFFYYDLKKIIQKRSQYNLPSVDDSVKSIIKEVEQLDGYKLSVKIRQKVK